MRIQRLELFGFKSFPDRTTFEFGSGISGVVGPNGSGKSNVVDALRWVIGEQSARSLRGKDMADVIFAGSAARSPVGFAEVTLTLSAAGAEPFPGDLARFEEVEVGRRLYRDGASEYLLNRVKCRRRDIVDLFMDTGVGSNLYSFIAQGQVDRIVSQSPAERRTLIDEAAGISRYKVRRDEALKRLEATATQLDRARDVSDEMARRLRSLEKQVIAAGRFRRLRAQLRQREIALGVVKYAALSGDRRALRSKLRTVQQDTSAYRRSVERLEHELELRQVELTTVGEAVSTWRDEAAELEAQRREAEGAKSLHLKRREELLEVARRSRRRGDEVADRVRRAQEEVTTLQARLKGIEEQLEALDPGEAEVQQAAEALATASARVARLGEEAARLDARRRGLEEQLEAAEAVPAPAPWQPEPIDRSALTEAEAEAAGVAEATREAEARWREAREQLGARRRQVQQARDAHREAERAWERRRKEHDTALVERDRRARRALELLVRQRRQALDEARQKVEARIRRWNDGIQHERRRRERLLEATAARVRTQGGWGIDPSPVEDAATGVEALVEQRDTAREALRLAEDAANRCRGRVQALQARFEVLEAQRRDALPEAWRDRDTLDARLDADAPLRTARPDLLERPVVDAADLLEDQGPAVVMVPSRWVVVPDLVALVAHLETQGPPVVTADGRVRVDMDGVVQVGRADAGWSEVRDELEQARVEDVDAQEHVSQVTEQLASTDDELSAATARLEAAREALTTAWEAEVERRRAVLEAEVQGWHAAATDGAESARAALPTPRGGEGMIALAWSRSRPEPVPARLLWEEPEVDTGPADRAEAEVETFRSRQRAADAQVARLAREVGALEQAQAVEKARHEAEVRTAEAAAGRARELREKLSALGQIEGREQAEAALEHCRERHARATEAREQARTRGSGLREERARVAAQLDGLIQGIERDGLDAEAATAEAVEATAQAEEAMVAMEESRDAASRYAVQRGEVMERLERDRVRYDKLKAEVEQLQTSLTTNRDAMAKGELQEQELSQRVEQIQLQVEGLRHQLGDRYQVSLPGLLDRLTMRRSLVLEPEGAAARELTVGEVQLEAVQPMTVRVHLLDDEDRVVEMVAEVDQLRRKLGGIGDVNLAAEEEYADLHTRFAELDAQRADLEASVVSIRAAIAKMNRTCRTRFRDAYDRVNEAFQLSYPKLVGGGDARLALTDDEDLLETGVDIFVRPPGKRLQNLTLLSGGEKAMTAIALLLALFKVRPSPFCVLDEVDAPLDEANGARFNEMVREMSSQSQFIVITHNRKTMECADVLYGVTMADPGVSKLVSVALS